MELWSLTSYWMKPRRGRKVVWSSKWALKRRMIQSSGTFLRGRWSDLTFARSGGFGWKHVYRQQHPQFLSMEIRLRNSSMIEDSDKATPFLRICSSSWRKVSVCLSPKQFRGASWHLWRRARISCKYPIYSMQTTPFLLTLVRSKMSKP